MPVLAIIMPTHNRARYAIPTIQSVLATSSDIAVAVCDTSEVDLISSKFNADSELRRMRLIRPNCPNAADDYTSHNTERLSVAQIEELLLTLEYVRSELA
jgi:hypothetical protein